MQEDNLTELPALKHRKITNTDLMELEAQRKDEKKQKEEGAEEPKRFTTQEMTRRCLFQETLLVFEAQDLKVKWYMKVKAAIQNAIQYDPVIYDEKKRATIQTPLN